VIAEARRSHPILSGDGDRQSCGDYCGIDEVTARFSEPLPEPPGDADAAASSG
jgi:hypothetical protein